MKTSTLEKESHINAVFSELGWLVPFNQLSVGVKLRELLKCFCMDGKSVAFYKL